MLSTLFSDISDPASLPNWMKTDRITDGALKTSSLNITPEILAFISELDEFKGAWQAIDRITPTV
jgi:hypothetical protein